MRGSNFMRRRLISWFLVMSVILGLFSAFPMSAFAFNKDTMNNLCSMYAYPQSWDDDGYFPTYTTSECTTKAGKIHKNDYCTINKFYYKNDKWVVKVTYPVSKGTKTAYAKAIRFFPDCYSDFEPYKVTAASKTNVSTEAGAATKSGWYINSGDKFYVITRDNNGNAQVVYPVSGGKYKMGWIKHYDIKYNANSGSGAPSTQHKIQNVNMTLSNTKPTRTGYTFNGWNTSKDGTGTKYSAGATYKDNKSRTLYAQWKVNSYSISVKSADSTMGNVIGGGTYNYDKTVTISAVANDGYQFVKWNDGNTSSSRQVKVNGAATYTAYFKARSFTMTVYSDDVSMGTVDGGSAYNYHTNATITAYPKTGHHFVEWDDGDTSNPRSVYMEGNDSYTAYFAKNKYDLAAHIYDIETNSSNNAIGSVSNTGTYEYGDYVTMSAAPTVGYKFVKWNDGNTSATRTIQILSNVDYYAYFKIDPGSCPHIYGDDIIDTEATCTSTGKKHRICLKCKNVEYDIIPKKDHTLGDWIEDTAATCENAGSHHRVCTVCKEVMPSENIEPLGHNFEETIMEPACTVKGSKTLTCKRDGCGKVVVEEILSLGHDYERLESTQNGYCTLKCKICGDTIERKLYTFGEDTYSFRNDVTDFARTPRKLRPGGETPTFDISTFYSVFSDRAENEIQGLYEANKCWNGVCFGMSMSSLAFYSKLLNLSEYTVSNSLYDIETPREYIRNGDIYFDNVKGPLMAHLRDLIEFFQISQLREPIIEEYKKNCSSSENNWVALDGLINATKQFVDSGEDALIIRVQGLHGQHAVVPIGYNESRNGRTFTIDVYDNAEPDEIYKIKIFKDNSGVYTSFEYRDNMYNQAISYNMMSTVYNTMLDVMRGDQKGKSEIAETLSYFRLYANSSNITVTRSDGVDVATLNEAYEIFSADSSSNNMGYLLPYGDYIIRNNDDDIEKFKVIAIGPKDTKIINIEDNKSTVHVGINTSKKTTYVKARKSNSHANLFSADTDTPISVLNINSDGVRDLIESVGKYVVLDTSNGTLDIASDVDTVALNGDEVVMTPVEIEDTSSSTKQTVKTSSGIVVSMSHIGSMLKSSLGSSGSSGSSQEDNSEKITSCTIGAQNIGFSTDAFKNDEYNFTLGLKSNNLTYSNNLVSGSAEFNVYNNSETSNLLDITLTAYANNGEVLDVYYYESMLGINNNYVKAEDIVLKVPSDIDFYVMATITDADGTQLSEEIEIAMPDEDEYSIRVIADNLNYEEQVIRGDAQINVHTNGSISGICKAILSFYDENGKLLKLYMQDVTIDGIDNYVPFTEINVFTNSDAWTTKCMLWSSIDSLVPLANPVVFFK